MGQEKAIEGYETYGESVITLLEMDEMAVDSMSILLEGEGSSILTRAELHERRAQQHFTTAAQTLKVAEQLEAAALVSERSATMYIVKATLQFVSMNGSASGRRMKREVNRGISFIQDNLDKLPDDVALYAQYEIEKAR